MADAVVGQQISSGILVKDSTGTLADVGTGPTCLVTLPDGTTSPVTPTHNSTGSYTATFGPTTQAGIHLFVWGASGANSAQFPHLDQVDVRAATLQTLVSLADVKDHLNITATNTVHDNELAGFIGAATEMVTFWTGPTLPTMFTEVRDGGGPVIMLDNPPVISITSVTEYVGLTAYVLTSQPPGSTTNNFGYSLDDATSGKLVRRNSAGMASAFWGGPKSVVIVYTAGVAGPVSQTIRMAVLEDLRGLYQQTQNGGRGVWGGGSGGTDGDQWSPPMNAFPRLNAILSGPGRTPTIA